MKILEFMFVIYRTRHEKTLLCCMWTTKTQTSLHLGIVWSALLLFPSYSLSGKYNSQKYSMQNFNFLARKITENYSCTCFWFIQYGPPSEKICLWGLQTTKVQTILSIRADWSVSLLFSFRKFHILTWYRWYFNVLASSRSWWDWFEFALLETTKKGFVAWRPIFRLMVNYIF